MGMRNPWTVWTDFHERFKSVVIVTSSFHACCVFTSRLVMRVTFFLLIDISTARNHSFCSPRWGAPSDYSPPSAYPPPVSATGRQGSSDSPISHFVTPRQAGMPSEVRPTATWPRTPKPPKSVASTPGSPSSARRNNRAAGASETTNGNSRDRDSCRPTFYLIKRWTNRKAAHLQRLCATWGARLHFYADI